MPDVMKTVGRYEILREVGRGGMAMVYLARQTDLDRFVALKELGAFHASDPSFAQRFLRESRVAGSLSHPNIVTVHDYFEHEGTPYIAMEYIERGSLRPYVGRMTFAQIGGVLEGLLAGLTHAESHAIVHRDLKPENLMVTADGRVKIADFGIAKATTKMQTGAFLTATGTTVGTPTYMAPEQAMAQDIGPWTDLYSVGCMAFELFTGNVPFHDSDAPMAILLRHVNEPIPPVKSIVPEVDARVSDWIEKLLIKDPSQRTQNAQDAWDDFEEIVISVLGARSSRWLREARLPPPPRAHVDSRAAAPQAAPAGGAPPMYTPPPSPSAPDLPEPVVGKATPAPAGPAAPAPERVSDPGLGVFSASVPQPSDAVLPPVTAVPPAGTLEPSPTSRFETYHAPAPSRPPTHDADVTPPAVTSGPRPTDEVGIAPTDAPPPPTHALDVTTPEPTSESRRTDEAVIAPTAAPDVPPPDWAVERSPGRSRRRMVVAMAAGVAIVAGLVVTVANLGGGDGSGPPAPVRPPPAGQRLSTSGVSLEVPRAWKPASASTPATSGFAGHPVVRSDGHGASVVFGRADATADDPTLLAKPLRKAAGASRRSTVKLGSGLAAYRYDGLSVGPGAAATVFVVPTSAGVATVVCTAGSSTCGSIASTLRITNGRPFALGPSPVYAGRLDRALSRLSSAQAAARATFRRAQSRQTQLTATQQLAQAHVRAAQALSGHSLSPADVNLNVELVAALRATGRAYRKAADDARRNHPSVYKGDGQRALADYARVVATLEQLRAAGYKVAAPKAVPLPRLRSLPVSRATPTPTPTSTATPTATFTVTPTPTFTPTPTPTPTASSGGRPGGGGGG